MYLEDPLPTNNAQRNAQLARETSVPICASETLATRYEYRELLESKACDVVMYDLTWCGGPSEARKISDLADTYSIPTSPHTCGGPLLYICSAHLCLVLSNFLVMESNYSKYTHQYPYFVNNVPVPSESGHVRPPERPGIRRRDQAGAVQDRRCHRRDGGECLNDEKERNEIMNNPLDFSGKVALVTGAASGMGLATAQAFAEAGAAVVLADFKEDAVKAAAEKLVAAGHKALAVRCDVSDDAQVAAMVDRTVAEFGRLDAAFNNAGVMARIAPTAESTREEWDRVIGINLRGVWSCMKHELRQMERQGSGAIVNNASVGALTGNPGIGSYIASKHGVVGLTRTAALEYVKHGIRVNAVNPGLIDTQIARDVVNGDEQAYAEIAKHVPIGRAGRPEEIASAVLWLCSPGASYVVGHALTVDGGMTVV